jgi:2-oxo-4-hydroxy-4-carboxy-5-ureidoimidazoline decarboxylase
MCWHAHWRGWRHKGIPTETNVLVNAALQSWNEADQDAALDTMLACCGARRWAAGMVASRPIANVFDLSLAADREWEKMDEADWLEAFACHPRIGERKSSPKASGKSTAWSKQEQASVEAGSGTHDSDAVQRVLAELARGNESYEQRFGFTYIVCATGRSAEEMLAILNRRLNNDRATELREAAEQQRQILQIRLGKWLVE